MGLARLGSVAAPLAIACVAASMAPAHAQTAPPGAAAALSSATREADRVQREQEERRQDQVRRDLERAQPRTSLSVPAPPGPKNAPGPCREITEITLKGAARLGGGQRAALVKPYAGRCLTAQDIAGLMGDVTKVYIDIGYATARVYLPPQDLRTGKLELLVVEGALSAVAPKRGRKSGVFVGGAFPGLKGRPLNLRDLEQGLDQLNRLESNHATMDIRPGERPGESLVVIANEPARRLHGLFAVDDEGSQSTGQSQMALTAVMDDLLGLNELISVTRRQSEPLNSPHAGISSSENYLASVPWGRWLVSAGYSESRYKSFITTPAGAHLVLRGDSSTGFGRVDRVIYRGRSHILTGSLTLNSKDSDNFINGQFLSSSSRRLTTVDAQADFSGPQLGGAFDVSFGYTRGIGAFNALKDPPGLTSLTPHATFDKVHLNISYYRPFGLFGRKFYWSSQAGGQYAFQTLYSTEQFSVGGFDTVRGFQSASLTNDHGASLRNDLGVIQPLRFLRQDGLFKFYTGFDSGYVIGRARGSLKGTLVSATVGASLSWWRASFDVYAANPIAQPSIVRDHGLMVRGRLTLHL